TPPMEPAGALYFKRTRPPVASPPHRLTASPPRVDASPCDDVARGSQLCRRCPVRVLITGATGTIGSALTAALIARGDRVSVLSRDPGRAGRLLGAAVATHPWTEPTREPPPAPALDRVDAVVHLLGEQVAQRWTDAAKRRIRDSRVLSTRHLASALAVAESSGPRVLISQSATGYYGACGDAPLDEQAPPGDDFLAGTVVEWEREALAAARGRRVVCTRTGVVLSPSGGALARMLPFFRLGVGGPVAGGRQYVPWIHLDDVVGGLLHCLDDQRATGAMNLTAADPVTNADFSRALGRALRRPAVLPVPGLALRLLYGQMSEMVTTGQRAVPARLLGLGFDFRHPGVEAALKDVVGRDP
ncbi:MAG: TIGR01777 family oxidoreductase, partial [Solirubrobacteraceae bacterium]